MQTKLQDSGPLQNALSALHNAEDQLRDATAKAASVGAYDDVVMITRWARALQILLEEANSPKGNGAIPENIADQPVRETVANGSNQLAAETSGRRKLWRTPIYTRDGDFLVKRARSRKTRTEYEHRAPADVIFIVAECLAESRSAKRLYTADQLIKTYSNRKGAAVSYQVYVALGWMTQIGVIRRHKRSGYSVPAPSTLSEDVRNAWGALGANENP